MKFEYITREWSLEDPSIEKYLNKKGEEGWELVSVIPVTDVLGKKWEKYVFKRQIKYSRPITS